jgi:hypothetical protein
VTNNVDVFLRRSRARSITLADPYLKTARAKEHLETLRQELSTFYKSDVCQFVSQDDLKNQRCRVTIKVKETPDRISLIVGDVFYNLRSALDQLVWCLAKLTQAYPRKTQFPIFEKPNAILFRRYTKGVPTEAVRIIESLQPYARGDSESIKSHLLGQLNEMCIVDKHMRIPAHSTFIDFTLPENILKVTRFEDGGVMNIPLSLKPTVKRHVKINPGASIAVVFGDSYFGIECDFERIETIYNFVTDKVIPRFARFFK